MQKKNSNKAGDLVRGISWKYSEKRNQKKQGRVWWCAILVSRHITEINSLQHVQKNKEQIAQDVRKGIYVKAWASWKLFSCNFISCNFQTLTNLFTPKFFHKAFSHKKKWILIWYTCYLHSFGGLFRFLDKCS